MAQKKYDLLPAEFAKSVRNHPDGTLLDVRTPGEYEQGHLPGAINIDVQGYDFEEQIETLDPHKAVYIYCRSGARSMHAMSKLLDLGFDEVYNLKGGMLAWDAAEQGIK